MPFGSHLSTSAGSGAVSMRPAALQSSMVRTARLPIASTSFAASASVLMSGVCSEESGSMQYTTPAFSARSATAAKHSCARASAAARVSPASTRRCCGEPCTR